MDKKLKIIYVGLGISIIMIAFLSVKIDTRKPVCERIHVDDIDRTKDLVPDEEMAKKIVDLYHDAMNSPETDKYDYNVSVYFEEERYVWIVWYDIIIPEGVYLFDGGYGGMVRRDNGMFIK